ncbi:hypothetical protein [Modestobacter marinus]|uniref:hypothetical protein n=1 Tax=Modestobacter marinus TaxID=477641 RepID=UPI001C937C8D|nr:hypothetical protein [Modestobacter marinus]
MASKRTTGALGDPEVDDGLRVSSWRSGRFSAMAASLAAGADPDGPGRVNRCRIG